MKKLEKVESIVRPKSWYKYQFYNPNDEEADDLGFVHFYSKKYMDRYQGYMDAVRTENRRYRGPSKAAWVFLWVLGLVELAFIVKALW